MPSRAEPISADRFGQAESPRVDGRTGELLWIDMREGSFHTGDLDDGRLVTTRTVSVAERVGAAAPLAGQGDGWVIGAGRDLVHIDRDGSTRTLLPAITPDDTRTLNDGVCAPDGAFWIGSQTAPRRPEGALYRIDPDLSVTVMLDAVTVSNGIAFDRTGTVLYYIDTLPGRELEVFRVVDGGLADRRVVAACAGGNPDGIALDDEGHVWVAMWDAAQVRRIAPDGRTSAVVELPVARPTAVALWDDLLMITTAQDPSSELSGRIFAASVDVSAPPTPPFAYAPASALAQTPSPTHQETT